MRKLSSEKIYNTHQRNYSAKIEGHTMPELSYVYPFAQTADNLVCYPQLSLQIKFSSITFCVVLIVICFI